MNAVIYYSNTGQCRLIAEYLADKSGFELLEMYAAYGIGFDAAILVFPVHCQNIPNAVKDFLNKFKVKVLAVVAAYGKMSFGNVLHEVQNRCRLNIAAAAYVPAKHAYLSEKGFEDFEKLDCIIEKLKHNGTVKIPKLRKNFLANILPEFRSRAGVKLYADAACSGCGKCASVCKNNAIANGKPNKNCIRCLKCVDACPEGALHFSVRGAMRIYLKKRKKQDLIIYI